jgi:DNA helicase-2/ATP-dependent DNA helicase PcrA
MSETNPPLNQQQQAAVQATQGPMLVVAGAGTGKTRVIVERFLRLTSEGVAPEAILALTFTEKAAAEMQDRINLAYGGFGSNLTIATFNSFGDGIVSKFGTEIGLGQSRLLGELGKLVFIRDHLDAFALDYFSPVSSPESQLVTLANFFSALKQQVVDPGKYVLFAESYAVKDEADAFEKKKHLELAHAYNTYLDLCRKQQVIDYDDQLYLSVVLLRRRPNIRKKLQTLHKYILVDEFQDTNPLQSALLRLLVGEEQNIMVVGDDDQSIYGWRGATLANILNFTTVYPRAKEISLIQNYRSTQQILDSAYRLIQYNNPDRLEHSHNLNKQLVSNRKDGPSPQVLSFESFHDELNWVAEDIKKRIQSGQNPASIAMLCRRNHGVQHAHEVLEQEGIAHAVTGLRSSLYKNIAVAQLLEALRAINDPSNNIALFHVLTGPLFYLDTMLLTNYSVEAKKRHESLATCIERDDESLTNKALQKIYEWQKQSRSKRVGQLAYDIMTESGWKQRLYNEAKHDEATAKQVQALSQYFQTLKDFEKVVVIASLQQYIVQLPTIQATNDDIEDVSLTISDTLVNVLSIHRSKGLEWETVYIIDCTEGSLPMVQSRGGLEVPDVLQVQSTADNHLAEERRLMYVAVTRAKTELICTYSQTHNHTTKRKPSRFLAELFGEFTSKTPGVNGRSQITSPHKKATENQSGSTVLHLTKKGRLTLSVSQVACWLRCPRDFYYKYVLQMPQTEDPSLAYGTLIHQIIQRIHEANKTEAGIELQALMEYTKEHLPMFGYPTKRARERAHTQANATVAFVYKRFINQLPPTKVEQSFTVDIPNSTLTMTGRIDAIYEQSDGGVEIVDYKTGTKVMTDVQAKLRATSSTQLGLYALAWQLLYDTAPTKLTLDFVETNAKGSVKKQLKTLQTLQDKLTNMYKLIMAQQYPEGKDHRYCQHPVD